MVESHSTMVENRELGKLGKLGKLGSLVVLFPQGVHGCRTPYSQSALALALPVLCASFPVNQARHHAFITLSYPAPAAFVCLSPFLGPILLVFFCCCLHSAARSIPSRLCLFRILRRFTQRYRR
jgi:hypothetical protein